MKNTIISIVLIVLTLVGWGSMAFSAGSGTVDVNAIVKVADGYVERGLYQRAIAKYNEALAVKESEDVRTKQLQAYDMRLKEDDNILNEFIDQLVVAANYYPKNVDFCTRLINTYEAMNQYEEMYERLVYAFANGMKSEELSSLKTELKYGGGINLGSYDEFKSVSNNTYTVILQDKYGVISAANSTVSACAYEYIGPSSSTGARVYTTEKDSRLLSSDGFVYGIFAEKVYEAGIFADGVIPVLCGSEYKYFNEFADEVFGGFEFAGNFSGGKAPVKKDGVWYFIDNTGKKISDEFADIVLDDNGSYLTGSVILAAEKEGKYAIYDTDLKKVSKFTCDEIDVCMTDGIIAYRQGEKWGYVGTDGKVIIEPEYEDAKSFSYGLAAVCVKDKWGFINTQKQLVIPCEYEDADYFNSTGGCMVATAVVEEQEEVSDADVVTDDGAQPSAEAGTDNAETVTDAENKDTDIQPEDVVDDIWVMFRLNLGIRND